MGERTCELWPRRAVLIGALGLVGGACAGKGFAGAEGPGPDPGERAYREALRLAELGRLEQALGELERSFEQGFPRPAAVLSEARMRPLREDAGTRKELRRLLKEHARQWSATLVDEREAGTPLIVEGAVRDGRGRGVEGALVYLYHTDAKGVYGNGPGADQNPRLFCWLRSGEDGRYRLRTIRPAHYPGMEGRIDQHVHFVIEVEGREPSKDRLGFTDDPCWANKGEPPPRWAVPVSRGDDGVDRCERDLILRGP